MSNSFSPHDAALDGTVSRTDRLGGVRDGSLHPGDLGVPKSTRQILANPVNKKWAGLPVVDDLRVELNLDNLTTLEKRGDA